MNLRQRKKLWDSHWFILRLYGFDFHSFNGDDVRHVDKFKIDTRFNLVADLR